MRNDGLELVATRPLVRSGPSVWFGLAPGDRALVAAAESIVPGTPLIERLRGPASIDVPAATVAAGATSGQRWVAAAARSTRGTPATLGELLFEAGGRWHVVAGEQADVVESPARGIVRDVQPGVGIEVELTGRALVGVLAVGDPSHGRLEIAGAPDDELRASSLDVGRSGAILVMGSRVDAETLIRARAMGIRGVIVASMGSQDVRDFRASEARLRASIHRPPPFSVLVLDGHLRRPIAESAMAVLEAIAGADVAILLDPPLLAFDPPEAGLPLLPTDRVRIVHGAAAGREGRWAGEAGRRRFEAGVHLDGGLVRLPGEDRPIVVPLADLERFV
ncbi:MAG TPA: hypothetical protein VIV06_10860 [Candidatus Limnocylindrales bacterium]